MMKLFVPLALVLVCKKGPVVEALPYGVKDPVSSMNETYFTPLSCNSPMSACKSWATWFTAQPTSGMATIPCGTCVKLDVADGSTVTLLNGLNVIGKLDVPATVSNVTVALPLLLVQGELAVTTSQTVISPQNRGLTVKMTGTNPALAFTPTTTGICTTTGTCTAGKKGIVVAGGKLTVDGWLDDSCPTWTSILDTTSDSLDVASFAARPTLSSTCPDPYATYDFESGSQRWSTSPGAVSQITNSDTPMNGNYFKVSGRTDSFQGPIFDLSISLGCLAANTPYLFSAWARLSSTSTTSFCSQQTALPSGDNPCLRMSVMTLTTDGLTSTYRTVQLDPITAGVPDGQWFPFSGNINFTQQELNSTALAYSALLVNGPEGGVGIDLDDFTLTLPSKGNYPASSAAVCTDLIRNGDAELNGINTYPAQSLDIPGSYLTVGTESVGGTPNKYFKLTSRTQEFASIFFDIPKACAEPYSSYSISNTIRVRNSTNPITAQMLLKKTFVTGSTTDFVYEQIGTCASSQNTWAKCNATITFTPAYDVYTSIQLFWVTIGDTSSEADYDNIVVQRTAVGVNSITVDSSVASCWGVGSELMVTSHTLDFSGTSVTKISSISTSNGKALITLSPRIPKVTSAAQNTNYPAEAAILTRNIVFEAATDDTVQTDGGHLTIFHTGGGVVQQLEGVELRRFGQQGMYGRYPIGAYFSDVTGNISRNSIRDSYQRCIVLTDVKGMTVSDNIAHNTVGHCFVLATGSETNNNFIHNLGAVTLNTPIGKLMSITETDINAATFYTANPSNVWTNNAAAGSESNGMWFELLDSVRGYAAKYYPLIIPSTAPIGSFVGNVFHSNGVDGLRFYPNGWYPSSGAILSGIKSYRNWRDGIYFQSTGGIVVDDGVFSDNLMGIEIDRNCENITVKNSKIIGYSDLYKSQVSQGGFSSHCPAYMPLIGVQLQSYLLSRDSIGCSLSSIQFSNFDGISTGCVGSMAIDVDPGAQDDHFSAYSRLEGLSFTSSPTASKINLCGIVASGVNDVMIRDVDGSNDPSGGGTPGIIVSSGFSGTPLLTSAGCVDIVGACAQYCPNVCLRALDIGVSPNSEWEGVNVFVSGGATAVFPTFFEVKTMLVNGTSVPDVSANAFYLRRRFATAFLLPGVQYTITFKSPSGDHVWPTFVEPFWRDALGCSPSANESSVSFLRPSVSPDCSSLIRNGDAENGGSTGYSGWLETGGIISSVSPGLSGSPTAILLSNRQNSFNGPAQFLDSRCFISGLQYEIMVSYKLVYAVGGAPFQCNPAITDTTLAGICPRGTLQIRSINGQNTNVTYLYPVASSVMPAIASTGNGFLYGYFTFNDDMAAANSILFVVERANKIFNIIVDDVKITQSSNVCASPILNADFEVGDNRAWYSFGNTSLDVVSPGADGSNYALRSQGRSQFWASPAQNILTDCIVVGDKFTISGKIKLEKNGKPYICDPGAVWGKVTNGTCPKFSFKVSKGTNATIEDIAGLTGAWNSSDWNTLNGAGTWSNDHKVADTLILHVSKVEANVTIYLDQVFFGSNDNWNCSGSTGILRNQNLETGDARYWTGFGGAIVNTIPGGAGNTRTAIAASNRVVAKSGVGQILDSACVEVGQLYQVSAMVKLLNASNGAPMDCLPEATYGPNTCPLASVMSQSLGGIASLHPVASVYNGTWKSGGQWNELRGYFTFFRTEKDAQTKMFVFERAGPGLTLVVDEVLVTPISLGSTTSSSLQV